ncbi:MAG: phosphodiester glycosidase family protein [Simkaniaceae bacterium]|nr:phosphodiester glycosidase family protein [Simkaniaceae bacterium]MCF7852674.1 phosphodiester glycosidase family protein [Simkaniaceae bacterium]
MKGRWVLLFFLPLISLFSREGLEYQHIEIPLSSSALSFILGSQSVHIIKVNPDLYQINPAKALGRQTALSISRRLGAWAAVNGGFFKIGGAVDGLAAGALKIGEWYALPSKPRGAIGWSSKRQKPRIDCLLATAQVCSEKMVVPIDGLNRPRKEGEAILFNSRYHQTTLTDRDGEELVIVNGVIEKVIQGGDSLIPEENGYVLSLQEKHPLKERLKVGMPLSFSIEALPQIDQESQGQWNQFDYIVGGCPLLIHHGSKLMDFQLEQANKSFLIGKCARTAVGILPNGNWVFVVVDKTGLFDGMTIYELSHFMEKLGCVDALNLDGGGSSTMVYEGQVKNTPRGDQDEANGQKKLRPISDAILILPQKY